MITLSQAQTLIDKNDFTKFDVEFKSTLLNWGVFTATSANKNMYNSLNLNPEFIEWLLKVYETESGKYYWIDNVLENVFLYKMKDFSEYDVRKTLSILEHEADTYYHQIRGIRERLLNNLVDGGPVFSLRLVWEFTQNKCGKSLKSAMSLEEFENSSPDEYKKYIKVMMRTKTIDDISPVFYRHVMNDQDFLELIDTYFTSRPLFVRTYQQTPNEKKFKKILNDILTKEDRIKLVDKNIKQLPLIQKSDNLDEDTIHRFIDKMNESNVFYGVMHVSLTGFVQNLTLDEYKSISDKSSFPLVSSMRVKDAENGILEYLKYYPFGATPAPRRDFIQRIAYNVFVTDEFIASNVKYFEPNILLKSPLGYVSESTFAALNNYWHKRQPYDEALFTNLENIVARHTSGVLTFENFVYLLKHTDPTPKDILKVMKKFDDTSEITKRLQPLAKIMGD